MNDFAVRIVKLEPLRVASFYGFGPHPESQAAQKLVAWAAPRGRLDEHTGRRLFGFNNPNPSPGSPNYGYEFWLTVSPEVQEGEGVPVKEFGGGLYAVTRCQGVENIGATWGQLVKWLSDSSYGHAQHQWLEEHLNPVFPAAEDELLLDLYAPIAG